MNDFFAITGLCLLCTGIWFQWGWPYSLMVAGIALLVVGVLGEINATQSNHTESSNS